ncbi:dicarboxylate/amino acid:cation symporter [Spiroplasma citri]|uniref:L-cystine uptake protein TcyP n=1 Tax=Spiroplasma citri TaxID=2133 RepID=A0AAJ4EHT4_SPICI|nr:dicarboxylate/amino acid:cation symporter [Spiroplasma citri]APE73951.1 proton/glutamate symporter [Spiroplasma citri]QIA66240.1 cation:dicarboxylase symporter family transporter [Spiroplasma citri]QIA68092.1 cation:dicarboxylase symporter family transporter [Spiroplasma citri]QIA69969.1 cation:dicarboxylase symporter family transporter [Spiroplasma citri]QIA72201.1 cation:dicarboxylase symporter family transporter [Spiroplasma citri]
MYFNLLFSSDNNNPLHDFLSISTWQSLVSILIFFGIMVLLWFWIKKTKMRFIFRVLLGLAIGLIFGITIQAINGFPYNTTEPSGSMINPVIPDPNDSGKTIPNNIYVLWVHEFSIWVNLFRMTFLNAILLMTAPVVFLAIARAVSKPGKDVSSRRGTIITITILLLNVAAMFIISLFIGIAFNIGNGFTISGSGSYDKDASNPLPEIIWNYVPSNFVQPFLLETILPVMVIAGLIGLAVKKLTKRHPEDMQNIRDGFDRWWTIIMSCLMFIIKLMPYSVMSMITYAIISRPIGYLAQIGIVVGIGYLCLIITLIWHSLLLTLSGVNPFKWWKFAIKPVIQGFTTQSSNATLPLTMKVLKDDMKVKENLVGISAPLTTTMGLTGCAGVQAGIIVSFISTAGLYDLTVANFFIVLLVVVVASLGIAGVPGTASVVTACVLEGIGLVTLYVPVYAIIGALDGIFDMGRTSVNIVGGLQATTIAARLTNSLENEDLILFKWSRLRRKRNREKRKKQE